MDGEAVKAITMLAQQAHAVTVGERTFVSHGMHALYHDPRPLAVQIQH